MEHSAKDNKNVYHCRRHRQEIFQVVTKLSSKVIVSNRIKPNVFSPKEELLETELIYLQFFVCLAFEVK